MDESELSRRLMETVMHLKRFIHKKPVAGLKHSEIGLIFFIVHYCKRGDDGIKISELSNKMQVTSPTITQLVTGLEESGLVERKMDKEDRRSVKVTLTEKGREVAAKAEEEFLSTFRSAVERMGEEKTIHLIELLNEFYGNECKKDTK